MNNTTPEEPCPFTDEELEIAARVIAWRGRKGGRKGGLSRSPKKIEALRANREKSEGRQPKKPDGIARAELRKELERVLGQKPLPKEGPVAKLVHIMTSANVLHKTWPAVRNMVPVAQVPGVADKLDDLLVVLGGDKLTIEERTGVSQIQTPPSATTTPNPAPVGACAWGGALKQG